MPAQIDVRTIATDPRILSRYPKQAFKASKYSRINVACATLTLVYSPVHPETQLGNCNESSTFGSSCMLQ